MGKAHTRIHATVRGNRKNEGLEDGARETGVETQREIVRLHVRIGGVRPQRWGAREVTIIAEEPVWQLGGWLRCQTSELVISYHRDPPNPKGSGCHHGKDKETWSLLLSYSHVKIPQKDLSALGLLVLSFLKPRPCLCNFLEVGCPRSH